MNINPMILVSGRRDDGLAQSCYGLASVGYDVERAGEYALTSEALERLHPALIVVEPSERSGSTELEQLEAVLPPGPPTPVLVIGEFTHELAGAVRRRAHEGALWDLAHREVEPEELLLRCEQLLDRAQRRVEVDRLRYRVQHDDRTDLLRPSSFDERLREHFSAARRHDLNLTLLLLDLDRFGQINKLHDHTVGDAVIARVGDSIRASLRNQDLAGRLGGDEFGILLPYTEGPDAYRVVQRLLDEIHGLTGQVEGAGATEISGSIGFETFNGSDIRSLKELRLHAERGLREAKLSGGNQGVYFRSLAGRDQGAAASG